MKKFFLTILFNFISFSGLLAQELIIGQQRVEPGIKFIFEGAIKDVVSPLSRNISEDLTNIHIEARVNWDEKNMEKSFFLLKNLYTEILTLEK